VVVVNDLVTYNRAAVAQACRRLADAALEAAAQPDDPTLLERVQGRIESLRHARLVLAASRGRG
jgi:hypothetical protein